MSDVQPSRNRDKVLLAVLVVITILIVGVMASSYLSTHDCCTTTSYSLSPSSTSTYSAGPGTSSRTTVAATDSMNVLELQLSLNTSSPASEVNVSIFADVYNPSPSTANVTSGDNYAVPLNGAEGAVCGDDTYVQDPTVGFAIAEGYYTSSNVTGAKFLDLVNPNVAYNCPLYLGYASPTGFLFQPLSDTATSYGCYPPFTEFANNTSIASFCMSGSASTGITAAPDTGYWNQGGVFVSFPRGTYTVLAEDEWGAVALAYFTVS